MRYHSAYTTYWNHMLIITIKQGKEKSLLAGDPLIYASAIEKVDGKPQEKNKPGATATVQTSSRQFLGRAAYNAKSQISARIWTYKEDEPVDHAMMKRRVKAASPSAPPACAQPAPTTWCRWSTRPRMACPACWSTAGAASKAT
jgi:23S rRNA (cytosine1962-C5)-methyltransferase